LLVAPAEPPDGRRIAPGALGHRAEPRATRDGEQNARPPGHPLLGPAVTRKRFEHRDVGGVQDEGSGCATAHGWLS
jgi:hypothetical protein